MFISGSPLDELPALERFAVQMKFAPVCERWGIPKCSKAHVSTEGPGSRLQILSLETPQTDSRLSGFRVARGMGVRVMGMGD